MQIYVLNLIDLGGVDQCLSDSFRTNSFKSTMSVLVFCIELKLSDTRDYAKTLVQAQAWLLYLTGANDLLQLLLKILPSPKTSGERCLLRSL